MDKRCDNEGAVEAQLELAKALDGGGESAAGNGSTEDKEILKSLQELVNSLYPVASSLRELNDRFDSLRKSVGDVSLEWDKSRTNKERL